MKDIYAVKASGTSYQNHAESGYGRNDEFQDRLSYYSQISTQRTIKNYLLMFRERIWYLIVAFFIILIGSILYTVTKTKVYTAVATVQLLRDDPTPMQMAEEVYTPNQILNSEDFNTQISILQSLKIIRKVEQRLKADELEQFMAPYSNAKISGVVMTTAEVLSKNRKIVPQRLSLIIGISYTHPDPVMAAKIANLFAEEFRDHNLKLNIEGSIKAVELLRVRADQQRERVEELELQLAEYREQNNAVSLDSEENIADDQLVHLNMIKLDAKNEHDQLTVKWNQIETYRKEGKNLWELPFIANELSVVSLLEQISQAKIQIATLSKQYREKHPVMIKQMQALKEAEAELQVAVRNSVNKLYSAYTEVEERLELATQRLAEKESELIQLSKTRVEYNSLFREIQVQQGFLQALTTRMTEENAQVNFKDTNVRIIDEALPPIRHSSPKTLVNVIAGGFGGLAFGTGLIFIISFFDDRIRSFHDVEERLGLSMLGALKKIKKLETSAKAQLVATNINRQITESFRSIYSSLKLNAQSESAQIILTTSTVPGEGKSFVSSNLAMTFASHGEKTLLLDCDLRLPNIARSLKLKNEFGVLDYLQRDVEMDKVIIKDLYPNLDVISSGGKSKNPTEVFNNSKFKIMLSDFRDRYDRIIIDSPPLAAVSDALNLLPSVDGVLYVIKFNTVSLKDVSDNVRNLLESQTPILGAILNDVPASVLNYSSRNKIYHDYYNYITHDNRETDSKAITDSALEDSHSIDR